MQIPLKPVVEMRRAIIELKTLFFSPWRLTVGLPLAACSQAADAQLLGAGKFALPSGAGSGCQSLGQYMVMGL